MYVGFIYFEKANFFVNVNNLIAMQNLKFIFIAPYTRYTEEKVRLKWRLDIKFYPGFGTVDPFAKFIRSNRSNNWMWTYTFLSIWTEAAENEEKNITQREKKHQTHRKHASKLGYLCVCIEVEYAIMFIFRMSVCILLPFDIYGRQVWPS